LGILFAFLLGKAIGATFFEGTLYS
jgi:hypothetical protein